MELRPPRWFSPLMAVTTVGLLGGAAVAGVAAVRGPVALLLVVVGLVGAASVSGALTLIGTRSVVVRDGAVHLGGARSHRFELDELRPPLEQRLFGVELDDGSVRRRVFAQLPQLTAALVADLPDYAPQLRPDQTFPVVLPGRISTPVAYGVFAALVVAIGATGVVYGVGGDGGWVPAVVGVPMIVIGGVTLRWVSRRAERRVEVFADRIERVHLLGRRSQMLRPLSAAAVVTGARRLPKSSLEREIHHLRIVDVDGVAIELAPMLAAFPDYGRAEGALMRGRARQLHRLHGRPTRPVELVRSPAGEAALWDHGESSPGAHRFTLVLPVAVDGRRAVPLLHGRLATGGDVCDLLVSYDDRVLMMVDLRAGSVRHVEVADTVTDLDPGSGRVVTRGGPVALSDLSSRAVDGWPTDWGWPGVPPTPWIPALERLLAELAEADADTDGRRRCLLAVRSLDTLADAMRPDDAPAAHALAHLLELARLDDPPTLTDCPGGGRPAVGGPEGGPECRSCGVWIGRTEVPPHAWPGVGSRCPGSLRASVDRRGDESIGTCSHCTARGALTHDGLVRIHDPV